MTVFLVSKLFAAIVTMKQNEPLVDNYKINVPINQICCPLSTNIRQPLCTLLNSSITCRRQLYNGPASLASNGGRSRLFRCHSGFFAGNPNDIRPYSFCTLDKNLRNVV